MFIVSKILGAFILPPGCIIALGVLFLILNHKNRKQRSLLFFIQFSLLLFLFYLLSIRPISDALLNPLESYSKTIASEVKGELIVVLGGGSILTNNNEGQITSALSSVGGARLLEGIMLHFETGLPLLFSGGNVLKGEGSPTEADAAGTVLKRFQMSADQYILEDKSRNTYENALFSAKVTEIREIFLVTSAFHMKRSILCFEEAGFHIAAAYSVDRRLDVKKRGWIDFLPRMESLQNSATALHEYGGILYYKVFYKL